MLFLYLIYSGAVGTDHVKELSEHDKRDIKLSSAASRKERRDRETGADGGEIVVWIHCTAIGEVGA